MKSLKAKPSTSGAAVLNKLQMPAYRDVEIHRVGCVVHPESPSREDDPRLEGLEGEMWVAAAIELRIGQKIVSVTDDRGAVPRDTDLWAVLKALDVTFKLEDLAGRPISPIENTANVYPTSLGNIQIHQHPNRSQIAGLEVVSNEHRDLSLTVTERDKDAHSYVVHGAAKLLCCEEEPKVPNFRVRAEVAVNRERAKKLLCPPCPDDCGDVTETLCLLRGISGHLVKSLRLEWDLTLANDFVYFASQDSSPHCRDLAGDIQRYLDPATIVSRALTELTNDSWSRCQSNSARSGDFKGYHQWNKNPKLLSKLKCAHERIVPVLLSFIGSQLLPVSELCGSCDDDEATLDPAALRERRAAEFEAVALWTALLLKAVEEAVEWDRLIADGGDSDPALADAVPA